MEGRESTGKCLDEDTGHAKIPVIYKIRLSLFNVNTSNISATVHVCDIIFCKRL